jgi:8-oxo-dGTP diphosphatase
MPKVKEGKKEIDGQTMYVYNFPRPSVAVDCVLFSMTEIHHILLIKRKNPPFQDSWALPGGFLEMNETSEQAARRELQEETSVDIGHFPLSFIGVYDEPERDPRGRVISIAYGVVVPNMTKPVAQDDAKDAEWFRVRELPELAFDHRRIINTATLQLAQSMLSK